MCIDTCTCYSDGMAQGRKRPTISLTLDPDVVAAARSMLSRLPMRTSLSELVDDLLREFVLRVGPAVEDLVSADPGDRLALVERFTGQMMLGFGKEFAETLELMQAAEIARAAKELATREE